MLRAVGFIGLGAMGAPMAHRFLGAVDALYVCDLRSELTEPFRRSGAHVCATPAEVASNADVVFASLSSSAASEAVALGADGIVHGAKIQTYVETSTIGMASIRRIADGLAQKSIDMLDCPVSGGPAGAALGKLSGMLSGKDDVVAHASGCLAIMVDRLFRVGGSVGQAQVMKLVNNLIGATNVAIACEAVVMGMKAGLDPSMMISVINASTGRNSATEDKFPKAILPRTFDYGAHLSIVAKDVALGMEAAREIGMPMSVAASVKALWADAERAGRGTQDFTSLFLYLEELAGLGSRSAGEE
ncbi:NAD(P)-dependent oxidoreductase [Parvibaculum sp.]|uniref:NAD(P)-dependent oxidoreductase n=1 Tax=Parvibaculum sp. TaxID=2024848 RepID=UPI003C764165